MSWLHSLFDFVLHTNLYLAGFTERYGAWVYVLLFAIIFCETGLVVTPFLPGDALLFAVGALAATGGQLHFPFLLLLLSVAAWLGDSVNYLLGAVTGARLFSNPTSRVFNRKHLERTRRFYDRYGAKTIILARYLPVFRTFAPFVAGMARMDYGKFLTYNLIGGAIWVVSATSLGYFFGGLPVVQHNFSLVIAGIVAVSMVPPALEAVRAFRGRSQV